MNQLDRRALLSAAGIAGVAAIGASAKAARGPLNPPAGTVTGTGRTLDEVYNKIPTLPNGSGDGRTPIPGGTGPVAITSPGSYVLTGNIDSASYGILITSSNVTLDLNGFRVATSDHIGSFALGVSGTINNVTVRNGSLSGGASGLLASGSLTALLIEDLRITAARQFGINISSINARSAIVRRCHVTDTGLTSTASDTNLVLNGITLSGDCHRIEDCTVTRFIYFGTGTPAYRGIQLSISGASSGCMISGSLVSNDVGLTGIGINPGGGFTVYRNNAVLNFSTPYSAVGSTDGGGNV